MKTKFPNLHLTPSGVGTASKALMGLALLASGCPRLVAQSNYSAPYTFSLLAGSGTAGDTDGTGSAARFDQPFGIAIDSSGNLFVTDKSGDTIRKVTSAGAVTTLAGAFEQPGAANGTGADARFAVPLGIAVGSGGDLYVADSNNNAVRKVTPAGVVTTFAGIEGTAGSLDGAAGTGALRSPGGVAVDSAGNVYVADTGNNSIRKVTPAGVISTLAGAAGVTTTSYPSGVASPIGSADGTGAAASFNQPSGIAIDSSGNLYVADTGNNTIRKVTSAGVVTTLAGTAGAAGTTDGTGSAARFKAPCGIAVDSNGNLYVADAGNSTVRKVTSAGVVTTLGGLPANYAVVEGTGSDAIFDVPEGIAVDASGNIYVTDKLGNVVRKGAAATVVTPPAAPVFTVQPLSVAVTGGTVVLDASATGASGYQWNLNGLPVAGATGSSIEITASALTTGNYTCVATNSAGSTTSAPATVALTLTSNPGHLVNLSARAQAGTGGNIIFGGFVIGPLGTGTLPVLIRASGPAIAAAPYNVSGTLADPQLQLFSSADTVLNTNNAWGGASAITTTASSVGAFAWNDPSSHDSALDLSLATGSYTAQVAGQSGDTGISLVEIYDASPAGSFNPALPHLTNLSARVNVGTGANILEAGFVIQGNSALTVLIRASGPAIAASPFNVPGTLADPQLTLQNPASGAVYATNAGWGADSNISAAASSVGAFGWGSAATKDSALLITLPPGSYTAAVAGVSGDTGVALVEVYEVK